MPILNVIARNSRLSRLQVEEAFSHYPVIAYQTIFLPTYGDHHQDLSLLNGEAPEDMFTRELDEAILDGTADVAVHSAKDLPYPLPKGIEVIALLQAFDTSDSLVSRDHLTLHQLPAGSIIGTSSPLRKAELLRLRPDLQVKGIRGCIEERVRQVRGGLFDAAIVATCALKRLGMEDEISEVLPFSTHPLQGYLAITARKGQDQLKTLFQSADILHLQGKVTLAGFGPGDPELLTVKAIHALEDADIIFYDDLIDQTSLHKWTAQKIYVGKRCGKHHHEQDEINREMLSAARKGLDVVRLKGGDPMTFAHAGEEIAYLERNLIEVRVIPGITAASALAADAKVSLTHRELASSVAFLSGHTPTPLAADTDTLIYYMGAARLQAIARTLLNQGRPEDLAVLLGYRVSLPDETFYDTNLKALADGSFLQDHGLSKALTPLIALVGAVAGLRQVPVQKLRRTLYTGLHPRDPMMIHTPLIAIKALPDNMLLRQSAEQVRTFDFLLFTSRYAVKYWMEAFRETHQSPEVLRQVTLVSIGPTTDQALQEETELTSLQVYPNDSYGVIDFFRRQPRKKRVLIPRSNRALPLIPETLTQLGFEVQTVTAYLNQMPEQVRKVNLKQIREVVFTSPSTIDNFITLYGELPQEITYVTQGAITAEYLANRQKMKRFRNYRTDQATRDRYADVSLKAEDFIYPYFVVEGEGVKEEIPTMPGVARFSIDKLLADIDEIRALNIRKVLLFGVIPENEKDERGTAAYAEDSLIVRAIRAIKKAYPDVIVFTDVCLCEYTSHGHCGLLHGHEVENDETLPLLAKMAYQHARNGADFVAPSAMMDGQVKAIKERLKAEGLDGQTKVLAYSAKYASAFYGPFRDAADSAPSFGDRKSYQMDFRTHDQGLEEIEADIEEGADWTMVKPSMPYLDIIARATARYPQIPMVTYQVSGEYAMLKAAAQRGFLDEPRVVFESLIACKRAGAQYIITYYAKEYVQKWA